MKRQAASPLAGDTKRARIDDASQSSDRYVDYFRRDLLKNVLELSLGLFDESGYIHGKVRMKWGFRKAIQLATEQGPIVECELRDACADQWDSISQTAIGDEVQIILNGVTVHNPGPGNKSSLMLVFSTGIIMRWIKAKETSLNGRTINTRKLQEAKRPSDPNDWYTTPPDPSAQTASKRKISPDSIFVGTKVAEVEADPEFSADRMETVGDAPQRSTSDPSPLVAADVSPLVVAPVPLPFVKHVPSALGAGTGSAPFASGRKPLPSDTSIPNSVTITNEISSGVAADQLTTSKLTTSAQQPKSASSTSSKQLKKHKRKLRREAERAQREAAAVIAAGCLQGDVAAEHVQGADECDHAAGKVVTAAEGRLPNERGDQHKPQEPEEPANAASRLPSTLAHSANEHPSAIRGEAVISSSVLQDIDGLFAQRSRVISTVGVETLDVQTDGEAVSLSNRRHSAVPQGMTIVHQIPPIASTSSVALPKVEETQSDIEWGFSSENGQYLPLAQALHGRPINVTGIVTSVGGISSTATGENKIRLVIVDPTNPDIGYSINVFSKKRHLPCPTQGDVLLMRKIQGDEYRGNLCGTAPSYKEWSFAVYNPNTGSARQPDGEEENKRWREPTMSELQHCARLAQWWKSLTRGATSVGESKATVHHITSISRGAGRVHLLICDASPNIEPSGFFDCTIEVLDGYQNDNGVHSLYVTDYTRNFTLATVQRDAYPVQLADRVLKIEMWNEAATKAQQMKPGEYYFIGNVRMKASAGGYVEATFTEVNKLRKLDEDMLEGEPHFVALLERKQQWEAEIEVNGHFDHQLLEEAKLNHHFLCTAEIIAISPKDDESACLYVTDYTARLDLVPVSPKILKIPELKNMVVRIDLQSETQVEASRNLEPGDFVFIRNLRLRQSRATTQLIGTLGGLERLINKLQVNQSGNRELEALLRRKSEWEVLCAQRERAGKQQTKKGKKRMQAKGTTARVSKQAFLKPYVPIQTVKDSDICPSLFNIHARIVDFYPERLKDFTIRRCSKCGDDISSTMRICTRCDDAMSDHSSVKYFYEFFIRVEDETGNCLDVSVSDEKCTLLPDLAAVHVDEDASFLQLFVDRVKPLFGNLLECGDTVEDARRRFINDAVPDTPFLALTIGSWSIRNGSSVARGYTLQRHTILE